MSVVAKTPLVKISVSEGKKRKLFGVFANDIDEELKKDVFILDSSGRLVSRPKAEFERASSSIDRFRRSTALFLRLVVTTKLWYSWLMYLRADP